ncbi:MAG: class I SAM-dependent methyltransferase [Frankiaceae bacterium]|nr:class I SAM-dependent methyltransferase [Frankiaceae bacterium]
MTPRWGSLLVAREYAHATQGWSDEGERQAFSGLLPLPEGARVLDIGVGGGRSASFLATPGVSYLAIDSSAEMVRLARRNYPHADVRLGDAADLSGFAAGSQDLVVFSLNGLDCLTHDQRLGFVAAAHRLLGPGGRLVFSTHNLDGPSSRQRPRGRQIVEAVNRPGAINTARALPGAALRLTTSHWFYRRNVGQGEQHDGWATAPLRAHEFRFVVHFCRLAAVVGDVRAAGLDVEEIWTDDGRAIAVDQVTHDAHYAHLVCRKPAAAPPAGYSA